jgi:hypothetical protein
VEYTKKTKIHAKIGLFTRHCLFLHSPQEVLIFRETLRAHIECGYVRAKKTIGFFYIWKCVFSIKGAYAHGSLNELPYNRIV